MLRKIVGPALSLSVLALSFTLLTNSRASASDPRRPWGNLTEVCPHCHSCLSKDVYYSEFYGYYRTCWRRWPGGQPPCPPSAPPAEVVSEVPQPETSKPSAATPEPNLPELLPTPKPEPGKK